MIDIVERLRHIDFTFWYAPILPHEKFERIEIGKMSRDAADEIERLRGALRYILTHCESDSPPNAKALILFVNNALKESK